MNLWPHCLTLNTFISYMGKSEIRAFPGPWKNVPVHTKVEGSLSVEFIERWLRFPMHWKYKCLNSGSNLFVLFLYVHFEGHGSLHSPLLAKRTQVNGAQGISCLEVIALLRTKRRRNYAWLMLMESVSCRQHAPAMDSARAIVWWSVWDPQAAGARSCREDLL